MGLSNFPAASEGVLPAIVVNTAVSMEALKGLLKSILDTTTGGGWRWPASSPPDVADAASCGKRRVSVSRFKRVGGGGKAAECSVCLSKFEDGVEVSELGCKHTFHRRCLDKWFDQRHSTCPLCRSIR